MALPSFKSKDPEKRFSAILGIHEVSNPVRAHLLSAPVLLGVGMTGASYVFNSMTQAGLSNSALFCVSSAFNAFAVLGSRSFIDMVTDVGGQKSGGKKKLGPSLHNYFIDKSGETELPLNSRRLLEQAAMVNKTARGCFLASSACGLFVVGIHAAQFVNGPALPFSETAQGWLLSAVMATPFFVAATANGEYWMQIRRVMNGKHSLIHKREIPAILKAMREAQTVIEVKPAANDIGVQAPAITMALEAIPAAVSVAAEKSTATAQPEILQSLAP